MPVIRAFAALVVALALLVIAAPAHACDERVTPDCNAPPAVQANDADNESNFVRRVPLRDTRRAARTTQKKSERTHTAEKKAAPPKRKPAMVEEPAAAEATDLGVAVTKPQLAEVPSAEPVFPIELEAPPVIRPMRLASASVGQSFDLSSEPEVAPRLSAELAPRVLDVAEVSPTGAGAERRSPSLQLAMKQEAERFTSAQEVASRPAETVAEKSFQLGPVRTAFLAFGGLLLLGTAARLVMR